LEPLPEPEEPEVEIQDTIKAVDNEGTSVNKFEIDIEDDDEMQLKLL
jgi:hypothetical protein